MSWYEPDEDGGSPITGYWVERYEPDHDKWIRCNKLPIKDTNYRFLPRFMPEITATAAPLSFLFNPENACAFVTSSRVKGLPTRKKYKFRVLAENLAGTGKPSKETDPILVKDPIGLC